MWAEDDVVDQLLVVEGQAQAVHYALSEANRERIARAFETMQYYVLNIRWREQEVRDAVARIHGEIERCCASYNNSLWGEAGVVITEDEIVRIIIWCYVHRGTLLSNPNLSLRTSFLDTAATRLKAAHTNYLRSPNVPEGVSQVSHEQCKALVRKLWEKASGHRTTYDARYHISKKRLRDELREVRAALPPANPPSVVRGEGVPALLGDEPGMPQEQGVLDEMDEAGEGREGSKLGEGRE